MNVEDFGAVANDGKDDTCAFEKAVAAGKHIFIPEGTYDVSYIRLYSGGYVLEGASRSGTVLHARGNADVFLEIGDGAAWNLNTTLRNFTVDMSAQSDAPASVGIRLLKAYNQVIEMVNVTGFKANSVSLRLGDGAPDHAAYTTTILNSDFGSTGGHIEILGHSSSDQSTTIQFVGCMFARATLNQVSQIAYYSPVLQGDGGFKVSNTAGLLIAGGDIEGTGTFLEFGSNVALVSTVGNFVGKKYSSGSAISSTFADHGIVHAGKVSTPIVTVASSENVEATRIALQAAGWPIVNRVGPTWNGGALTLAANLRPTSATTGDLDTSEANGAMVEVDADNNRVSVKFATPGANPRSLSEPLVVMPGRVTLGTSTVVLSALPTSAVGLPSGALWRDAVSGNTIKIVP